ncbi:DUF6894 family protein [Bradyrhizobium erythrophlei]|uniref:DUF6894 domain-containing protein n=1 Tax=Bradyrhizobium erythrophlei TaxID=1437360 RepID=A0A1M7UCM8_9BRAD|nr:hypothetical protein [Bradyrhizobium erythrophlei]SHN80676.1 hypothetical protein SAMN05444170_4467 [Bradyrhizobium erythrophlei]
MIYPIDTGDDPSCPKWRPHPVISDPVVGNFFRHLRIFHAMPKYFFHVTHVHTQIDDQGEELPDKHAAWKEATETAGQILQDIDGKLTPGRDWRMEVTDEFQNTLFVLHISAEEP